MTAQGPSIQAGKVYLVGAGPGNPGLITLRGAEVLARADVVAYDRLVGPAMLAMAPQARHVYVGRAPGEPDAQRDVNDLLIREARQGRSVVRLKGGDPFVFGRGGEECEALEQAGVAFEVVPGVTSAVAGPAYAGVPLTHRDHASWVAIATGHTGPDSEEAIDWRAMAAAPTAVFLMALRRLPDTVARLLEAGRDPQTPAAVVASATLASQQVVRARLSDIAAAAAASGISPPALLVVGETVALAERLDWVTRRPLWGRRILVTRPEHQGAELVALLRGQGADVAHVPVIEIVGAADPGPLDEAIRAMAAGAYAWLTVTSANAVDVVAGRLGALGLDARAFRCRVAAVGPATADRLTRVGIRADLIAAGATGRDLAHEIGAPSEDQAAVLYPRAERTSGDLQQGLRAAGWTVDDVPVYRTVTAASAGEQIRRQADTGVDVLILASGSAARAVAEVWGSPPESTLVCCIGPSTASAAQAAGIRVDVVAAEHTAAGVVAALVDAVRV